MIPEHIKTELCLVAYELKLLHVIRIDDSTYVKRYTTLLRRWQTIDVSADFKRELWNA